MLKRVTLKAGQKLSEKELDEIREAAQRPIQFDEDAPELSPAMYKAFECVVRQRNRMNRNVQ